MTRFDAATAAERESLVADVIEAHRERESPFCTVEADGLPDEGSDDAADEPDALSGETADEETPDGETLDSETPDDRAEATPAWVQFSETEGQLNLDCTDEEYDRITSIVSEFPTFTIQAQESPEDADGRNLRVEARADADRIGQVVDRIFVDGFGYDEEYRLWATEL